MKAYKIKIQIVEPSDADLLCKFGEKTFRDAFEGLNQTDDFENYVIKAFSKDQIKAEILDPGSIFFVVNLNGEWAGYAKLYKSVPPDCVIERPSIEIARLYAEQKFLGKGVGQALVKACLSFARDNNFVSVWLGSWKENHRGNAFYRKMQFKIVGDTTFELGSDIQEDFIFSRSL